MDEKLAAEIINRATARQAWKSLGLSPRAITALTNYPFDGLADLKRWPWVTVEHELARSPNCGAATLAEIKRVHGAAI